MVDVSVTVAGAALSPQMGGSHFPQVQPLRHGHTVAECGASFKFASSPTLSLGLLIGTLGYPLLMLSE